MTVHETSARGPGASSVEVAALQGPAASLIELLLNGIEPVLRDNLVGLYVRGSLALGDFIPETSDVDLLAVTDNRVSDREFEGLLRVHDRLSAGRHPLGRRHEIAYIDRDSAPRFLPGETHPTLGPGESLAWSEHGSNWVLERWAVREHGLTICGPPPAVLIDAVPEGAWLAAVRERLDDWAHWADELDDPDWQLPLSHKAYAVETICRALAALTTGRLLSKRAAVAWALQSLGEPWRSLVRRAQGWRTDSRCDPEVVPQVAGFVRWAASCAGGPAPATTEVFLQQGSPDR